jgi:hypothetical protein
MSDLEWHFQGAPLPSPGQVVLGCKFEGWRDREHKEPLFSFELLRRCRVGSICGERRPDAEQVSWYNAVFSSAYGQEWPSRLVCWSYLEAPQCAVRAKVPEPKAVPDGPSPAAESKPWGHTATGASVHRLGFVEIPQVPRLTEHRFKLDPSPIDTTLGRYEPTEETEEQ